MSGAADVVRRHLAAAALVSAALLALGAASAASPYSHVDRAPPSSQHKDWAEKASYAYVVPVERNSTHWANGTILPMGMPAYYRTITQNVTVTFAWRALADGAQGPDYGQRYPEVERIPELGQRRQGPTARRRCSKCR